MGNSSVADDFGTGTVTITAHVNKRLQTLVLLDAYISFLIQALRRNLLSMSCLINIVLILIALCFLECYNYGVASCLNFVLSKLLLFYFTNFAS